VEKPKYQHPHWRVSAVIGGVAAFALMDTADLPTVGWRFVDM